MKYLFVLLLSMSSYQVSAKVVNLSINPIAAGLGVAQPSLDFRLSKKFAIGASVISIDYDDELLTGVEQKGDGYSARALFFFNEVFTDSWFISAEYAAFSTDVTLRDIFTSAVTATGEADYTVTSLMLGYLWQWSYFNISLAMGAYDYNSDITVTSGTITDDDILDESGFGGDLRIGLAF